MTVEVVTVGGETNLLEDFCVTVVTVGAVYFSTVKFPWNGRGVTRIKTGNQTGD